MGRHTGMLVDKRTSMLVCSRPMSSKKRKPRKVAKSRRPSSKPRRTPGDPSAPHVAALKRAIAEGGGSQRQLARRIAEFMGRPSVRQQTIWYWLKYAVLLDPEWWPAIEHATNGKVTAADLRPDLFHYLSHGPEAAASRA